MMSLSCCSHFVVAVHDFGPLSDHVSLVASDRNRAYSLQCSISFQTLILDEVPDGSLVKTPP